MKILIIGSGGREHCLGWKLAQSPKVEKIFYTGINAGLDGIAESVPLKPQPPFSDLVEWSRKNRIDLTVVGPEDPLASGIVDAFEAAELRIFGPSREAARIEASKVFAKELMVQAGIPTGKARVFDKVNEAIAFLEEISLPVVIKAEGLAAGKGVIICDERADAVETIKANLDQKVFGAASNRILIEEYLTGEEASLLAFVDGKTVVPMITAQDHKPIFDGDKGPNTGGMGAYAPAPLVNRELYNDIVHHILEPTVKALTVKGIKYKGIVYAGLMITKEGAKVLEFNCRFGDPETQAILPLLNTDIVDVMEAVIDERLDEITLEWRDAAAVCVIMASGGYPGSYEKGKTITGLDDLPESDEVIVFHAGTKRENGVIKTNGGRVLGLTTVATNLQDAIEKNYSLIDTITFDGRYYRNDIGKKALKYL